MILRPFLNDESSCASYLFGCLTHSQLAVVDPHADLVDHYIDAAAAIGAPITAVFETHVQADHVSGLPALVERTGACAYLPGRGGCRIRPSRARRWRGGGDGRHDRACARDSGPCPAHHAYLVSDHRRGTREPWLAFTGDSLLIGDVGRPDLHVAGDAAGQARLLHGSLARLLDLADGVVVLPSHYAGSVCGRALSANPFSSIGFERHQNAMLAFAEADAFAEALLRDTPPRPPNRRQSWRSTAAAPLPRLDERDTVARLRANAAQFSLLVALNALVGGMVGSRTKRLTAGRRAGLQADLDRRHPRLRGRVRPGQGDHEPGRRRARRSCRTQAAVGARLVGGAAGAAAIGFAPTWASSSSPTPARRQRGPRLVNDGGDEDRPCRARAARSRARLQRSRRLPGRRDDGVRQRCSRRDLRASAP